jgi:predicted enzyme related to lactoylglutathione lyase
MVDDRLGGCRPLPASGPMSNVGCVSHHLGTGVGSPQFDERNIMLTNTKAFSGFSVDDIAKAKQFYGETLGVTVTEANGMLQLHTAGDRDTLIYPKQDHVPAAFTILNFEVDDIEAEVDELTARGVQFEHYEWVDPKGINRQGGPLIAWFTDPAGNILSVIQSG